MGQRNRKVVLLTTILASAAPGFGIWTSLSVASDVKCIITEIFGDKFGINK